MNYLFQKAGLQVANGVPTIDFSRQNLPALNENSLSETAGFGAVSPGYRSAWYAPLSGVVSALATTPAKRHCDGSPLNGEQFVRIDQPFVGASPIDWNGDLVITANPISQDITCNGVPNASNSTTMPLPLVGAQRAVGARVGTQSWASNHPPAKCRR